MRLLRGLARCAVAAALLAASGARGDPPRAPKPPAAAPKPPALARKPPVLAQKPAPQAGPAGQAAPRTVTWSESEAERSRVTPGILVRAAKRAQQRDGAACSPCTARPEEPGDVEAIEIDWHAATGAP